MLLKIVPVRRQTVALLYFLHLVYFELPRISFLDYETFSMKITASYNKNSPINWSDSICALRQGQI